VSKRLAITLIKYGLGLGLLFWVVYSNWDGEGGLREAVQKPANYGAFVLALLICLVSVLLTFVRWYLLVRAQDLPFTFPAALRLGCVGYFFNTLLPGAVGGDIIKATFIARAQSRRTVAVATVLLDRAVGLCGLFWLAAILGSLFWATGMLHEVARTPVAVTTLETIVIGSIGIMAASLLFWLVLGFLSNERAGRIASGLEQMGKVGHALAEFWRAVWLYRCRGRSIALALGLAIVGHAGFVLVFFFAAQTFTPAADIPSVGTHFLIVPVGMTIQAGFPAPGGVGAAEYGYGKLYELLGYSAAAGVLGSLTKRMIEWILGFGAYLVYLRMKPQLAYIDEAPAGEPAAAEPKAVAPSINVREA
jgi:glycosyltransferase 2 family protein